MKTTDFIKESIGEDADNMHRDHEVQMARSDCYNAAKYAIELHKMLHHVAEQQGLDGWVSEKITLANDYLRTVWEYLSHEMAMDEQQQTMMPMFNFESADKQFSNLLAEGEPGDLEHELERQEYERDQERDTAAEKQANKDVDESYYDRGDYYDAKRGGEYGKNLTPSELGGGSEHYRGAHKTAGVTKKLPADPFGRTTGKIPDNARPKKELDPFRDVNESASAGASAAGGFAVSTASGGKPGTGKPKAVTNMIKRAKPKFGKGIY